MQTDEITVAYTDALIAERNATVEQIELASEAQYSFNLLYSVDRHLAHVIPQFPEEDRHKCAAEIAVTCNGQGVGEACRQYASALVRNSAIEKLKSGMLDKRHSRNDTGNGEKFAEQHHDRFKFLDDRKTWIRWDDKRWRDATESDVQRAAKKTAKKLLAEALRTEDKDDSSQALASLSYRGISNIIKCAQSEKILISKMEEFDRNPELLTVENGTIDLRTGRLYSHAREDMITTLTNIEYDPTATCEKWEKFLVEVFDGDLDLIAFIQRAVGYSLTGLTLEQAFFILWGGGKNGKGRFIRQLMALLGDAARTTRFQTFTSNREMENGNTPALAALAGSRLVSAGEPDDGVRLSESIIKMLTGEDEIQVCRKHEHPFYYLPSYKIWLHCNHKPAIRGTDEGIWRRPRLIPFNVSFVTEEEAVKKSITGARKDPDLFLDKKLNVERPGILAWAVRGSIDWFKNGLGRSSAVEAATKTYRDESDTIGPFIQECIEIAPGEFVTHADMCSAYSAWCSRNLVDEMKGQSLSKHLVARGFIAKKNGKDVRGFDGISVVGKTVYG